MDERGLNILGASHPLLVSLSSYSSLWEYRLVVNEKSRMVLG